MLCEHRGDAAVEQIERSAIARDDDAEERAPRPCERRSRQLGCNVCGRLVPGPGGLAPLFQPGCVGPFVLGGVERVTRNPGHLGDWTRAGALALVTEGTDRSRTHRCGTQPAGKLLAEPVHGVPHPP
jgi:hypothetical protein